MWAPVNKDQARVGTRSPGYAGEDDELNAWPLLSLKVHNATPIDRET